MKRLFNILLLTLAFATGAEAQELFAVPQAPDTCTSHESRCNYIVQHYWDKCDLTKPFDNSKDSLLVATMANYFDIMRAGANVNLALGSVRDLMFKAQANKSNFMKLISAAEYLLYMRPTPMIDDVYLAFAQSAADASWAKKEVRDYYGGQVGRIKRTKLGEHIVDLPLTLTDGTKAPLSSMLDKEVTIIFISDGSTDTAFERTRLFTDISLNQSIENGTLRVINILADDAPKQWDQASLDCAAKWTVGANKDVLRTLDVRIMPCILILDAEGNVQVKNYSVDNLKQLLNS